LTAELRRRIWPNRTAWVGVDGVAAGSGLRFPTGCPRFWQRLNPFNRLCGFFCHDSRPAIALGHRPPIGLNSVYTLRYGGVASDAEKARASENLVGERTRVINRMKASPARLGLRDLNPAQRKAAGRVDDLRTPEDGALPPLAKAELRRANPSEERDGMVRLLTRVVGVGVERSRRKISWVSMWQSCGIDEQSPVMPA
jgi:hypothetical protein